MDLRINIKGSDPRRLYLEFLNGILGLTSRELDCLLLFLSYSESEVCGVGSRESVRLSMNFKSVGVLNNYIKSLKDKGVIYVDRSGIYRYSDIVLGCLGMESLRVIFE